MLDYGCRYWEGRLPCAQPSPGVRPQHSANTQWETILKIIRALKGVLGNMLVSSSIALTPRIWANSLEI